MSFDFKSLKIISECPVCHKRSVQPQVQFIEESDGGHLLHIQCGLCGGRSVVLVSFGAEGLGFFGVLTDLSSEEVRKLLSCRPLNADDVLELHEVLQGAALDNTLLIKKTTNNKIWSSN